MAIGEVLKNYVVGIEAKDEGFSNTLTSLGSKIKGFVSTYGAMLGAGGLGLAFKSFIDSSSDLANFSSMTGIAVEEVSALGQALEQFGGNTETAKSSLLSLQQSLNQAQWGEGSLLQTSAKYGINLFNNDGSLKDSKELLMSLADDFKNLDKATQFQLGSELGLDKSTILLLQQGKQNIQSLIAEQSKMGVVNAREAALSAKFSSELIKLKNNLSSIGRTVAVDILPPLIKFIDKLKDAITWVKSLDTYTIVLAASIAGLAYGIKNLSGIITLFGKAFTKSNRHIMLLVGGLTLLFLLIEDVYSYTQGKKSLFGDMLNSKGFQKILDFFKSIAAFFVGLKDKAGDFIGGLVEGFKNIVSYIGYFISTIGARIKAEIFETINSIIDKVNSVAGIFGKKDMIGKLDIPTIPTYESYKAEKQGEKQGNINNNNNNITINLESSGNSLLDITNATEKGLSKALILNGVK